MQIAAYQYVARVDCFECRASSRPGAAAEQVAVEELRLAQRTCLDAGIAGSDSSWPPLMSAYETYLGTLCEIRSSGEATDETSYYGALANLLNAVGARLTPSVHCVMAPKDRGAGFPDGAVFVRRQSVVDAGPLAVLTRAPERGVIEVKGPHENIDRVAESAQVRRYLERYGQVLVTNYRDFLQVRLDGNGTLVRLERHSLAGEADFWSLTETSSAGGGRDFEEFVARVLMADAPLASPADVAWFLAAYARTADARLREFSGLPKLRTLRTALEDALEITFTDERGVDFFRSTLIQTLFYGVFAAWITWATEDAPASEFSWRTAQWSLNVPMVRVLFEQLATPRSLPAGLDEILDWTEAVLRRVDASQFLERLDRRDAIEHFYEPFLQAYDPDLRRRLGVWYTPPEVVRYMVRRTDEALRRDLGIPLGLADERVHVLDPATGTGSFLVATLEQIVDTLNKHHRDSLVAQQAKEAAIVRLHGFELLPAPFVIAHLRMGMALAEIGAPLDHRREERASIYLTNALTGWVNTDERMLPFAEFQSEREAAGTVKRKAPILVVLGNPPYNGYAGVSGCEEEGLLDVYKSGLSDPPWEITKNKLDDYYVRFFRVAERRIAETTGVGIVCFITNSSYLGDPSAVMMRKHLLDEFDVAYVDNLNGDSRETGKKTPAGATDPSIFATRLTPGIQVGTAISLLARTGNHSSKETRVSYRDFWGAGKREALLESLSEPQGAPPYESIAPSESNWYRLRPWNPRPGYDAWPQVVDLAATRAELGLNENRNEALIALDRQEVASRLKLFLNPHISFEDLRSAELGGLLEPWSDYEALSTRNALLKQGGFDESHLMLMQVRPFDLRWAYVDPTPKLWNRSRPRYTAAAQIGSESLLVRRRAPRALDGSALHLSANIVDQHVLHKDAYTIPLLLPSSSTTSAPDGERLFQMEDPPSAVWEPNLSELAIDYLAALGFRDIRTSRAVAKIIWLHALAIGYSPLYLEENGDAVRNDWPRIPLPKRRSDLEDSARLGARLAALCDIATPLPGIDVHPDARILPVGDLRRTDGATPREDDLTLTARWGIEQRRKQKSGAQSVAVMPGEGKYVVRERSPLELEVMMASDRELLGDCVLDVYLNEHTYWSGVPEAAWRHKIGGHQVLRKWLGYRERSILGRSLTFSEARQFQSIARRLTEIARMTNDLDANYRAACGMVVQDPLPMSLYD